MTEQEWLASDLPHWLLKHLRPWKSWQRKLCHYVCASFRKWDNQKEPVRILLEVAAQHADGLANSEEYKSAKRAVTRMTRRDKIVWGENGPPLFGQFLLDYLRLKNLPGWEGSRPDVKRLDFLSEEVLSRRESLRKAGEAVITEEDAVRLQKEYADSLDRNINLLRCIFGPLPFRAVSLDPAWLIWNNKTAVILAQMIYDNSAYANLPILADVLEEAGCTDLDILNHCRKSGEHVRGCWVLDLILGKE